MKRHCKKNVLDYIFYSDSWKVADRLVMTDMRCRLPVTCSLFQQVCCVAATLLPEVMLIKHAQVC